MDRQTLSQATAATVHARTMEPATRRLLHTARNDTTPHRDLLNSCTLKRLVTILAAMLSATALHAQQYTIEDRVAEFGEIVRGRLAPKFDAAGVPYPPRGVALIAIKQTRVLQVYASGPDGTPRYVSSYPILAASGTLGPKLREGDRQVPEGIYRVRELNPNSLYHLSIWLDYPNEFDLAKAALEGRTEPGSEIMIHGDEKSRGCLAMGDPAAEDLFVLAALTGVGNVKVILAPADFRTTNDVQLPEGAPSWTAELYDHIKAELAPYPAPPKS